MPLRSFEVIVSSISSLLWASPTSHYSTVLFGKPYSIALRSSTWIMRPPMFIHIPFTNIPSLITPTIPHTFVPFYFVCSYRFRHLREAHQSHWCNEASVFAFATVCLFAYRELGCTHRWLHPPTKLTVSLATVRTVNWRVGISPTDICTPHGVPENHLLIL